MIISSFSRFYLLLLVSNVFNYSSTVSSTVSSIGLSGIIYEVKESLLKDEKGFP